MKTEVNRDRVTIGRDKLEYEGYKSTVPATLSTVKVHLNSIISTLLARYMTMDIKYFFYGTLKITVNGKVYFEIRKGMPCTPSLWKHSTLPISFTLVVDDLGVKYVRKKSAQHLIDTLRKQYEISTD